MIKKALIELIVKPQSGEWGKDDSNGEGVPVIRTANFTDIGKIDYSNIVTRDIPISKMEKKALSPGDIIIEKSGGSDTKPVGRVVYYDGPSNKYLYNNFTAVLRVKNENEILPKYLFYYMYSFYQKKGTLRYENKTTGLHNLKLEQMLNEVKIPIINVFEQEKIVAILDKINNIIASRKQQLAELDTLIKARFIKMFGDPLHPVQSSMLGEIAVLERGRFSPRPRNDPQYYNGNYPFIQTGDIANCEHRLSNYKQTLNDKGIQVSKKFSIGTIVIAIVGATIGATAILEIEVYAPDSVVGISIDNTKYNKVFLETLLQFWQPELLRIAPESARANINLSILQKIPIIETEVEKQNLFAAFVDQVGKSKNKVQKSVNEMQLLFESLIQKYFE